MSVFSFLVAAGFEPMSLSFCQPFFPSHWRDLSARGTCPYTILRSGNLGILTQAALLKQQTLVNTPVGSMVNEPHLVLFWGI